uniref:RNase H type-1 domain-containing protein n=1 Tax=Fagus sylvatica TaxID=28930 RepID=A0A2N9G5M6_FAGSY
MERTTSTLRELVVTREPRSLKTLRRSENIDEGWQCEEIKCREPLEGLGARESRATSGARRSIGNRETKIYSYGRVPIMGGLQFGVDIAFFSMSLAVLRVPHLLEEAMIADSGQQFERQRHPSSSSHVLWQCDFAQMVWKACPVTIPSSCSIAMNFRDFISCCLEALFDHSRATGGATNYMKAGLSVQDPGGVSEGFEVATMQQQLVLCDDTLQLQAMVVLAAVQFAFDVGFRSLEVDISYKDLFHLLKTDSPCLASIGSLVDDVLFVKNSCHVCQFHFVKSLYNKATLALATEAFSSVSF